MIAKQAFEVVVDLNNRFAIQDSTFMLQIINQENNCIIAYNTSIIQQYKLHDRYQKRSKMNSNYGSKIENAKAQSCKGKDGKVEEWNEHRMHGKTHFEGTLILTSTKVCNLQTFTLISHSILKVVRNSLTLCYHLHDSHGCTIFHWSCGSWRILARIRQYLDPHKWQIRMKEVQSLKLSTFVVHIALSYNKISATHIFVHNQRHYKQH